MSKRPTLGLEAVVRPSRLANKGEAVPALVQNDASVSIAAPVSSQLPGDTVSPGTGNADAIAELLTRLAERDSTIDRLRAEREELEANLAASDATTDALRNLIADLRSERERLHGEVTRLIDLHAAERQRMLEEHKAERDFLRALNEKAGGSSAAPAPTRSVPAPAPAPAEEGLFRRLFGGQTKTPVSGTLNGRPIL